MTDAPLNPRAFLHRHIVSEQRCELPENHVIVDYEDWEKARSEHERLSALESENEAQGIEYATLKRENDVLAHNAVKLLERTRELESENVVLKKQNALHWKTRRILVAENAALKTTDLGKQVVRNLELMADLKAANDTFVELRAQLSALESENAELRKQIPILGIEIERLMKELSAQSECVWKWIKKEERFKRSCDNSLILPLNMTQEKCDGCEKPIKVVDKTRSQKEEKCSDCGAPSGEHADFCKMAQGFDLTPKLYTREERNEFGKEAWTDGKLHDKYLTFDEWLKGRE